MRELFLCVTMFFVLAFSGCGMASQEPGASGADLTPATERAILPRAEQTCTPLGGSCSSGTECCWGRCINRRCLKL